MAPEFVFENSPDAIGNRFNSNIDEISRFILKVEICKRLKCSLIAVSIRKTLQSPDCRMDSSVDAIQRTQWKANFLCQWYEYHQHKSVPQWSFLNVFNNCFGTALSEASITLFWSIVRLWDFSSNLCAEIKRLVAGSSSPLISNWLRWRVLSQKSCAL